MLIMNFFDEVKKAPKEQSNRIFKLALLLRDNCKMNVFLNLNILDLFMVTFMHNIAKIFTTNIIFSHPGHI